MREEQRTISISSTGGSDPAVWPDVVVAGYYKPDEPCWLKRAILSCVALAPDEPNYPAQPSPFFVTLFQTTLPILNGVTQIPRSITNGMPGLLLHQVYSGAVTIPSQLTSYPNQVSFQPTKDNWLEVTTPQILAIGVTTLPSSNLQITATAILTLVYAN